MRKILSKIIFQKNAQFIVVGCNIWNIDWTVATVVPWCWCYRANDDDDDDDDDDNDDDAGNPLLW